MVGKKFVFICGCPRSGTSISVKLLNCADAFIFSELFLYTIKPGKTLVNPEMFLEEQVLKRVKKARPLFNPENIIKRMESKSVIGDKVPHYYKCYEGIVENFKECKFLFIYRNYPEVEASYARRYHDPKDKWSVPPERAIDDWNEAALETLRMKDVLQERLVCVKYEDIFKKKFDDFYMKVINIYNALGIGTCENTEKLLLKYHNITMQLMPAHLSNEWSPDADSSRASIYTKLSKISL